MNDEDVMISAAEVRDAREKYEATHQSEVDIEEIVKGTAATMEVGFFSLKSRTYWRVYVPTQDYYTLSDKVEAVFSGTMDNIVDMTQLKMTSDWDRGIALAIADAILDSTITNPQVLRYLVQKETQIHN